MKTHATSTTRVSKYNNIGFAVTTLFNAPMTIPAFNAARAFTTKFLASLAYAVVSNHKQERLTKVVQCRAIEITEVRQCDLQVDFAQAKPAAERCGKLFNRMLWYPSTTAGIK